MSDVAIRVENLSKRYRIGERERYYALRDVLTRAFRVPFRRCSSGSASTDAPKWIWALKDVSFEVKRGEVVGIIGRNGAGKTTLLKILARITEPTEGYAEVRGRVGSLLEVGTGFHPELTGRENIYLSGAILGMKKAEIDRKFDEIVAFAGVEKFIDTPVKHYSTGMHMRLAFSVAAHLDPEILLVDEVLAVGDLEFQKKCLGKMGDVAKGGRTVLFVSHQMNQIRRLCERVLWVDAGHIRQAGPTHEVVSAYETAMTSGAWAQSVHPEAAQFKARFLRWEIVEPRTDQPNVVATAGPISIRFILRVNQPIHTGVHGLHLFSSEGQTVWGVAIMRLTLESGLYEFLYNLDTLPLRPGAYFWLATFYDGAETLDYCWCPPELIVATPLWTHPQDRWGGLLNIPYRFDIRIINDDYKIH
ncbi:MAG: polysaccharide ABC transporter ATP-binding protein [Acidobacteria bacterium]|nr:polysaccharide ABC transporter ATP-binding protein [Acidobacteriota bacterium]MDW7983864.1 polysaccharide ABC transporter ATP-binding protein [Acidobacteriota bacterium]